MKHLTRLMRAIVCGGVVCTKISSFSSTESHMVSTRGTSTVHVHVRTTSTVVRVHSTSSSTLQGTCTQLCVYPSTGIRCTCSSKLVASSCSNLNFYMSCTVAYFLVLVPVLVKIYYIHIPVLPSINFHSFMFCTTCTVVLQ